MSLNEIGNINKKDIDSQIDWEIGNFCSSIENPWVTLLYKSSTFSFAGSTLHFELYPKSSLCEGFSCIYLYWSSPKCSATYEFGFQKSDGSMEKLISGFMNKKPPSPALLFKISEIKEQISQLAPSNVATVRCFMKIGTQFSSIDEPGILKSKLISCSDNAECTYCHERFEPESISSHKKCTDRPIKCPECSRVVLLQDWYEHECQTENDEGEAFVSEFTIVLPENQVLHHFKELFFQKEHCDVTVKVKGQNILSQKAILRAHTSKSEFCSRSDMREKSIEDTEDLILAA